MAHARSLGPLEKARAFGMTLASKKAGLNASIFVCGQFSPLRG